MGLSPYFLRRHYPDQVRETALTVSWGIISAFYSTPTDNGMVKEKDYTQGNLNGV